MVEFVCKEHGITCAGDKCFLCEIDRLGRELEKAQNPLVVKEGDTMEDFARVIEERGKLRAEVEKLINENATVVARWEMLGDEIHSLDEKLEASQCQVRAYEQLIAQFHIARSGWIHHSNGPHILKKLWEISHTAAECIHTYTAEGVGAAGYSYCIYCGEPMQNTSKGSNDV